MRPNAQQINKSEQLNINFSLCSAQNEGLVLAHVPTNASGLRKSPFNKTGSPNESETEWEKWGKTKRLNHKKDTMILIRWKVNQPSPNGQKMTVQRSFSILYSIQNLRNKVVRRKRRQLETPKDRKVSFVNSVHSWKCPVRINRWSKVVATFVLKTGEIYPIKNRLEINGKKRNNRNANQSKVRTAFKVIIGVHLPSIFFKFIDWKWKKFNELDDEMWLWSAKEDEAEWNWTAFG